MKKNLKVKRKCMKKTDFKGKESKRKKKMLHKSSSLKKVVYKKKHLEIKVFCYC